MTVESYIIYNFRWWHRIVKYVTIAVVGFVVFNRLYGKISR